MTHTPLASIEALLAGNANRTLGQLNDLTDELAAQDATGRRAALCALRVIGGKLLAISPARGANQNIKDGAVPKVATRKSAAEEAGLSERKCKTAIRIAKVPYNKFVALLRSENPPTIEAMAALGTTKVTQDQESSAEPEECLEVQLERIRKAREKRFNALATVLKRQYLHLYDQWMAGSLEPEAMLKAIARRPLRQRRRSRRAA